MRKSRRRQTGKLEFRGQRVRNQFELAVLKEIHNALPRGRNKPKVEYEPDYLDYCIHSTYNPDFKITKKDGSFIYIEAKGKFDYQTQRKMKAVKETNPELDIRIVFQSNGRIRKGSKMRYGDWADKNGFPWSIGEVPKEWFNE